MSVALAPVVAPFAMPLFMPVAEAFIPDDELMPDDAFMPGEEFMPGVAFISVAPVVLLVPMELEFGLLIAAPVSDGMVAPELVDVDAAPVLGELFWAMAAVPSSAVTIRSGAFMGNPPWICRSGIRQSRNAQTGESSPYRRGDSHLSDARSGCRRPRRSLPVRR